MSKARRKSANAGKRHIRRMADLPSVPVVASGSNTSGDTKPPLGHSRSESRPDPVDERIRRMIEAAYTSCGTLRAVAHVNKVGVRWSSQRLV